MKTRYFGSILLAAVVLMIDAAAFCIISTFPKSATTTYITISNTSSKVWSSTLLPHQTQSRPSAAGAASSRVVLRTGKLMATSSTPVLLANIMSPLTTKADTGTMMSRSSFWLIRILLLRSLGFVSIFAFLIALHQNKALIGTNGITPASNVLQAAEERAKVRYQRRMEWEKERKTFRYNSHNHNTKIRHYIQNVIRRSKLYDILQKRIVIPFHRYLWDRTDSLDRPLVTLLWFGYKNRYSMDQLLDGIAYLGLIISCILVTKGAANVPLLALLWLCQQSLMSVGGPWYGFGWETMLAELTFHLMFMVPMFSMSPLPVPTPVPMVTIYALRWFLFRIMIGSGLIKLRSNDNKWKDLTVMNYFYETMVCILEC